MSTSADSETGFAIDSTGLGVVRSAWRWLSAAFATSEASSSTEPRARRFGGLDGLRALAVVAVLCYHALPGMPNGGFLGVDIFFVLSGFLITSLIVDQAYRGTFSLRTFWDRRLRRIVPAVVVLLLGIGVVTVFMDKEVLHGLRRQTVGALSFSYNWMEIASSKSYFNQYQPEIFRNLWSLAVEMQFYLVWPLLLIPLLAALPKAKVTIPILAAAGVSVLLVVLLYVPGEDPTRVYYGTDTHAFGLLLGAGLACLMADRACWRLRESKKLHWAANSAFVLLGLAALGGLVVTIIYLDDTMPIVYPWGLLVASGLAGVAVLAASASGSWFGWLLDIFPLRWVGERSYGVYLWHWPIAVLLSVKVPWPEDIEDLTRGLITLGVSLTLSIAAAAWSYRYIETPIRQHGWLALAKAAKIWIAITVGIAALTVCLVTAPDKTEAQVLIEQGQSGQGDPPPYYEVPPPPQPVYWPPIATQLTVAPKPLPAGNQILAIGDSVMLGCADVLRQQFPGIVVNASVSRSFVAGLDIVASAQKRDTPRPVIIYGLLTNGGVNAAQFERLLEAVSPRTTIVLVTAHGDRSWIPPTNAAAHKFAAAHRNVLLADWDAAIKGHKKWMASDGIHPRQEGREVYVKTILETLRQKYRG